VITPSYCRVLEGSDVRMSMMQCSWLQEHVVEYLDDMLEPGEAQHTELMGDAPKGAEASTQHGGRKREVFAE
jgi:hypothetical protein